ncbi:MAG: hypothetical protein UV63_C0010G0019 [Microgenomates group bacterium GW2011_GWC1_43_11]|nr:MAG: hypothetical protein UV63_C0010G0019 [Microgenomates group bacterium GW2011_GWC1_43_11]KKT37781.1 MAG: hypothetical protein UW22_C0018G0006 [Candidatus Gottesmanbacteria bacterium GW2011_GWB1_44_11c]HCM82340.1 acyltransferase [Patescibacteria group bacterium]
MKSKAFNHGIDANPYNPHAWILGSPIIGEDVWIGPFTLIDARYAKVTIGRGCDISTGAHIISHSTVKRCISERKYNTIDACDTVIEKYCFIGSNAVILMGSRIGHHSLIAAGCVVKEHTVIPPYSLVAGVPGKIISSSKKFTGKT